MEEGHGEVWSPKMGSTCPVCGKEYKKNEKQRKIYRKSLLASVDDEPSASGSGESRKTALTALYESFSPIPQLPTPDRQLYSCDHCFNVIRNYNKSKRRLLDTVAGDSYFGKRKRVQQEGEASTSAAVATGEESEAEFLESFKPLVEDEDMEPVRKKVQKTRTKNIIRIQNKTLNLTEGSKKAKMITAGMRSMYGPMVNHLSSMKNGRKAMLDFVQKRCQAEVTALCDTSRNGQSILRKECSPDNMKNFSWNALREETSNMCPFLTAAVDGATLKPSGKEDPSDILRGMIMCQVAFNRKRSMKFMQQSTSLVLRLTGANKETMSELHHLRICQSYNSSTSVCNQIANVNLERFQQWKAELENPPSQEQSDSLLGYTLTFDNVNIRTLSGHDTISKQGVVEYNMVHLYAARDRVPAMHLPDREPTAGEIRAIPTTAYVVTEADMATVEDELVIEVKKILRETLACFSDCQVPPLKHRYWEESAQKSDMIGLGVLNLDENTDIVPILEEYQKACPHAGPEIVRTVLYGDQLSCERAVNNGQRPRLNANNREARLQGVYPSAQEWHMRVLVCQSWLDKHYTDKSATDKGTLYQIRNFGNHMHTTSVAKRNYNKDYDLVEFSTYAYVSLFGMQAMKIRELDAMPETSLPPSGHLEKVSRDIVRQILPRNKKTTDVAESIEGRQAKLFCVCRKANVKSEGMVFCHTCEEWYHYRCVGVDPATLSDDPDEKWTCPECTNNSDHVYAYSKSLTYDGLFQMAMRDAIRQNDGPRMLLHWKMLLYSQFASGNPKYQIEAVRLLTAVNGGVSTRIRQQLIWNRAVNYTGGYGKNKAADLQMEHYNRILKDSLRASGVKTLTEDVLKRHGGLVSNARELRSIYRDLVDVDLHESVRHTHVTVFKDDVRAVVANLIDEELVLDKKSEREHQTFKEFKQTSDPAHPRQLGKRIREIREDIASDVQLCVDSVVSSPT